MLMPAPIQNPADGAVPPAAEDADPLDTEARSSAPLTPSCVAVGPIPGKILYAANDGVCLLKFVGEVRLTMYCSMDQLFGEMISTPGLRAFVIDVTEATQLDSTVLGMLARLSSASVERLGSVPTLVSTNPDIDRLLLSMGFDDVFHLSGEQCVATATLEELSCAAGTEAETRAGVIAAHKALMALNATNEEAFKDLVAQLESCP